MFPDYTPGSAQVAREIETAENRRKESEMLKKASPKKVKVPQK